MKRSSWFLGVTVAVVLMGFGGCQMAQQKNDGFLNELTTEPAWIRNAEPVEFEGAPWFPTDDIENLLDNEVYQAGVYREIPFYIDRADVRPFERIYILFARNKYRACEKQP
jgi:hypothetical protein